MMTSLLLVAVQVDVSSVADADRLGGWQKCSDSTEQLVNKTIDLSMQWWQNHHFAPILKFVSSLRFTQVNFDAECSREL